MSRRFAIGATGLLLVAAVAGGIGLWTTASAQSRAVRLVSPAEGELVQGPNVTFTVEFSGIKLPDEHFHVLIDGGALRYVLGNPIPTAQVDMVHFRAASTTVRLEPGPHFVVLVPADAQHVPFKPWISDSRYFFVR